MIFEPCMKKLFAVFVFFISFSIFVLAKEYKIDGSEYSKQIFDEENNQVTKFKNWELIQSFYVSPDCSKMLVYHRPDKAKAFLFTLYDLSSNSVIAETEPGWACQEIQFTDDYLIWIWGTSGGGTRYVYLNYKDLSVYKVITSYYYIGDIEHNQLITWNYHGDYSSKDEVFYVFFYNYTNANETDKISQTFLAKKIHEQIADADIAISGIHIEDFEKIGQNKYKITVSYCSLNTKTDVETFDNIKTIIYER